MPSILTQVGVVCGRDLGSRVDGHWVDNGYYSRDADADVSEREEEVDNAVQKHYGF